MTKISEAEFARLCIGIFEDGDQIFEHNPIGTRAETLLWMLLSVLHSFLSLSDIETPCFNGVPTEETYKEAIRYVLRDRKTENFDVDKYLNTIIEK